MTAAYRRGAEAVLELARLTGAEAAVLKERSPSCGSGAVYDGTFSGTLTAGWGAAAGLLREQGTGCWASPGWRSFCGRTSVKITTKYDKKL